MYTLTKVEYCRKYFANRLCAAMTLLYAMSSLMCVAQQTNVVDGPDLKIGDTWVTESAGRAGEKQRTTLTVKEITADRFILETPRGERRTYTRDLNETERRLGDTVSFAATPNFTFYYFPMKVGDKREASFVSTSPGRRYSWRSTTHVDAVEEVTVAAGTFKAFKVSFEAVFTGSGQAGYDADTYSWSGWHKQAVWYSPEVKGWVKSEYEVRIPRGSTWSYYDKITSELISFTAGK